ncbi:uncharacterized protein LOC123988153 [Osmia bicornis bicornis]|uniref:uncharacterized protein LOC123988153 n=1 Tax=Osmia bicornis bicornis TaxID=1437191 RepID=UPI001EAF2755|nr:uncharacterized protein LOC123988153 [Osmia bicornis bicornis]
MAIQEAVGQSGEVRTLSRRIWLEVLDMDCLTTSAEVEEAVRREIGDDLCGELKVAVFAPNVRELRMVVVELDDKPARKLLEKGKLHAGWGNLNGSRVADDLLTQLVHEHRASVAIISEPCQTRAGWHVDSSGSAAIWIVDPSIRLANHGAGCCYVWVTTDIQRFRDKLEALEDDLRDISGRLVVAGDFNARAIEWGMPQPNTRGKLVLEMVARLGLAVLNVGTTSTYRRPGFGYSIPDITLVSEDRVRNAVGWKVMDDFTGSDHQYITFQLIDATRMQSAASARRPSGWNAAKMDGEKFVATLLDGARHIPSVPEDANDIRAVDALVDATMGLIHRACDASMPRKRPWKGRTQAYWWNDQIAELRRLCHRLRRLAQRSAGRPDAAEKATAYKVAKKALGKAIRTSKERSWKQLCDEVDQDPWGRGYKLVMAKLRPPTQVMDERKARNVVDALFPTHPVTVGPRLTDADKDIPLFRTEELMLAERSMKSGKARVFPARWKLVRLTLISKGKGNPTLRHIIAPCVC